MHLLSRQALYCNKHSRLWQEGHIYIYIAQHLDQRLDPPTSDLMDHAFQRIVMDIFFVEQRFSYASYCIVNSLCFLVLAYYDYSIY